MSSPARATVDAAFESTDTEIVDESPVPELGVIAAHETLLEADHEQFAPFAVTPIVPVAAPAPNGLPSPVVFSVTLHAWGAWVIWKACPPIVSVPVLE